MIRCLRHHENEANAVVTDSIILCGVQFMG